MSLGKTGSREVLQHEVSATALEEHLDSQEPLVRPRTRGLLEATGDPAEGERPAGEISGLLLRSALVAGWPAMDVRAYSEVIPPGQSAEDARPEQLRTLRLERLGGTVLLALFDGVPELVVLEEPSHGLQLGVARDAADAPGLERRAGDGRALPATAGQLLPVPMRSDGRTLDLLSLRRALHMERATHPSMPEQLGSADLAIELIAPPYRQRFE